MKECVFCGHELSGQSRAREHVFPRWLLARLGLDEAAVRGVHVSSALDGFHPLSKRIQAFDSFVFGRVCETCNSGWMSQLEDEARRILECLMPPASGSASLDESARTTLANWTFKTAAMLNLASNYRQIVPPYHLHLFHRTGCLPRNSAVDLAIGSFQGPFLWMQGGVALVRFSSEGHLPPRSLLRWLTSMAYVITLDAGGTMLRLSSFPVDSLEATVAETSGAVRIWPTEVPVVNISLEDAGMDVTKFHWAPVTFKVRPT